MGMIETVEDRQDFETIYKTYRKQMFFVVNTILNNDTDSEDVVHDVFMKIAARHMSVLKRLRNEQEVRYYLLAAAKNTAINMVKRKCRSNLSIDNMGHGVPLHENLIVQDDFLDVVAYRNDHEKVMDALIHLKETYRDVLYFYLVMDLSVHEIASILDRNLLTVKKQVTRGKQMLCKLLEKDEVCYLNE